MIRKPSRRSIPFVLGSLADWLGGASAPPREPRSTKTRERRLGFESLEGRVVLSVNNLATISGTIFNDTNGGGIPSDGPGIQGVTVNLYQNNLSGSPLETTTTNVSGVYSFTGLTAGTYLVQEIVPAGYDSEVANNSVQTVVVSSTAAAGTEGPVIDTFNVTDQTVDASSTGSTSVASSVAAPEAIGGNRDLVAQLTSAFGDVSLTSNAFNQGVLEFNSSATGTGDRIVDWDGANSATPSTLRPTGLGGVDLTDGGATTGIELTLGADHDNGLVTFNVYKDATDWSTVSATMPNTGGAATDSIFIPFSSFTVGGGTGANFSDVGAIQMKIEGNAAANGQIDNIAAFGPTVLSANFANYQPASVGTTVFWDMNKNGLHDAGENGMPGVTVNLMQNSQVVGTTTTNSQGTYAFTGLAPGSYSVEFVTPDNSTFTLEGQGSNNTLNSDVDPSSGSTPIFSLTSGENDVTRNAGLIPVDLSLTKTVDNSTAQVGSTVHFTVTVSNAAGYSQATGVQVNDLLPAGLTFVSSTPAQGTYNNTTGLWNVGTIAAGGSTTLVIAATVNSTGTKTNTGTVTATDEADVALPASLTSSASVTPVIDADLALTKTVNNSTPNVGQNVTFTIGLSDLGPSNATGVAVTDQLPAGLTFVSDVASQGSYNSTSGVWTVGNVTTTTPLSLQIVATVTTPGAKTNTATITANDDTDTNPNNNTASATVTPQQADLSLTKTVSNPTPSVGQNVTYTVTVSNAGPNTATDVVTTDVLPAGMTFVSDTASQGSYNSTSGVWTIGSLAAGATPVTLHIVATVATTSTTINSATVTGDQYDPTLSNNTATATTTPAASVGTKVFWDVNHTGVDSTGDQPAANVTVELLQNNNVVSTTTTNASGNYLISGIAPGTYTVKFVPAAGTVFTTQGVGGDPTNNSSANPTTGVTPAFTLTSGENDVDVNAGLVPVDLSVTKTVDNSTPFVGNDVHFTVTVSNASGVSQATGVQVTDLLPAGLTFVSATPVQGTYNSTTGIWSVGTLASGASTSLTITAAVATSGTKTNTATVTASDQPDPTTDPDSSVTVTPSIETKLSKFFFLGR